MKPRSLRLRLLMMSTASVVTAVALAGVGLVALFSNHVERSLRADLDSQVNRLVALIDPAATPLAPTQGMPDPRFSLPYGDLYWQVRDPATGELARSRSLLDSVLVYNGPFQPDGTTIDAELPDPQGNDALASIRRFDFELDGSPPRTLEVIVAETTKALDVANEGFRNELIPALLVLAMILVLFAWVQVTHGLSPLRTIQRGVNAIRTGKGKTLEGEYPLEVMPLVTEVNDLILAQETSIEFARARAADLAHGLKTALTVLNGEAEALRKSGNAQAADNIEQLAQEMTTAIDHQLRLSRLRRRPASSRDATGVAAESRKVVATLNRTPRGATLDWQVELDERATVTLDPPDLRELLGIVAENAVKWAATTVRIVVRQHAERTQIVIEDDGEGLDPHALAAIGARGKRLDESKPGTGIGLSIAREIVALNGGTLRFERSTLGGLRVEIVLRAGASEPVPA